MKKLAGNIFSEADALKEVENTYASLEDFCLRIYALSPEQKEALLGDGVDWDKKAGFLKISKRAAMYIMLRSEKFQQTMSQLSIRDRWNFLAQDKANSRFVADTHNVAEKPDARVKVAQYLNQTSGITRSDESKGRGLTINLSFGEGNLSLTQLQSKLYDDEQAKTITVDSGAQAALGPNGKPLSPYRPARSGDDVPEGVRILQEGQSKRLRDGDTLLPAAAPRSTVGRGAVVESVGETEHSTKRKVVDSTSSGGFSDLFG